jgi:hypothetical protein
MLTNADQSSTAWRPHHPSSRASKDRLLGNRPTWRILRAMTTTPHAQSHPASDAHAVVGNRPRKPLPRWCRKVSGRCARHQRAAFHNGALVLSGWKSPARLAGGRKPLYPVRELDAWAERYLGPLRTGSRDGRQAAAADQEARFKQLYTNGDASSPRMGCLRAPRWLATACCPPIGRLSGSRAISSGSTRTRTAL